LYLSVHQFVLNMSFRGLQVNSTMPLFTLTVEGFQLYEENQYPDNCTVTTEFKVKRATDDVIVNYPTSSMYSPELDRDFSLSDLKELYFAEYGPYKTEILTPKILDIFNEFKYAEDSEELLRHPERFFVRKMWLFKRLHELFEDSMNLIVVRMSKLLISIYEKAVEIMRDVEIKGVIYTGKNVQKYTKQSMDTMRRVRKQVVNIIAENAKFIRLLSPTMLRCFIEEAEPWMVAKFRCLPWIEPELAVMVAPSYNHYWSEFWFPIIVRHFKISTELCRMIADYVPTSLKGETFLDYFTRKFDLRHGYREKRVFIVDLDSESESNHYLNKYTITL